MTDLKRFLRFIGSSFVVGAGMKSPKDANEWMYRKDAEDRARNQKRKKGKGHRES